MRRTINPLMLLALVPFFAFAQEAQPQQAPAAAPTTVEDELQGILEEPASADTYRYDPQGRRDPFRSLIGPTPKIDVSTTRLSATTSRGSPTFTDRTLTRSSSLRSRPLNSIRLAAGPAPDATPVGIHRESASP